MKFKMKKRQFGKPNGISTEASTDKEIDYSLLTDPNAHKVKWSLGHFDKSASTKANKENHENFLLVNKKLCLLKWILVYVCHAIHADKIIDFRVLGILTIIPSLIDLVFLNRKQMLI